MPVEDDHVPFLRAGVPAVDIIDLDYAAWHTAGDTLDAVSARSLQIVGDVIVAALPAIEARLLHTKNDRTHHRRTIEPNQFCLRAMLQHKFLHRFGDQIASLEDTARLNDFNRIIFHFDLARH